MTAREMALVPSTKRELKRPNMLYTNSQIGQELVHKSREEESRFNVLNLSLLKAQKRHHTDINVTIPTLLNAFGYSPNGQNKCSP